MEMREILISTKADREHYLIFDRTNDKLLYRVLLYRVCKFNDLDVLVNYYKSLKDVSNVIVKE